MGGPPGRPYGLAVEAKRILRIVERDMSQIGSGKMAGDIVSGIKTAVDAAMVDAKREIVSATTELTAEIRDGAKAVKRAIQVETANVRAQFGVIVGNAQAEAEEAVDEAKKMVSDDASNKVESP
jgi:hypothetical protein